MALSSTLPRNCLITDVSCCSLRYNRAFNLYLKKSTLTINKLSWRALVTDTEQYRQLFAQPQPTLVSPFNIQTIQPRLCFGLDQLIYPFSSSAFMLVRAPEEKDYLDIIATLLRENSPASDRLFGGRYTIENNQVTLHPAVNASDNFTSAGEVVYADWIETEQLFGCVRQLGQNVALQPGLIHQANGGVLILSLRTLLSQPLLWLRLKHMVELNRFDWFSPDEARPLPVSVPPLSLQLKIVLVGDRESLADFQVMEPELSSLAIYSEFEDNLQVTDTETMTLWQQWVRHLAATRQLPVPDASAWPILIREATRYTQDQETLPLYPSWILRQLRETAPLCDGETFNAGQMAAMLDQRAWREGFLAERMQDEILLDQILVETEGDRIGQINALSVIEFPGHPRAFGEPSRISCVVHIGDGEFIDIERKAELGGNIHAKGMMIMQAFLMSELQLEQQIPFSASLTFEQSYSEVDGDSASMAELCALISALADMPLHQNIAITGSVDQFGRAQPVGGLNEKIEGFFAICQSRELTGTQGVIIPSANVRHLSLSQPLLDAVENEQFSVWAVDDVRDALPLLTGLPWDGEGQTTLIQIIQERITQATQQEGKNRYPWPLGWLNWFNHN